PRTCGYRASCSVSGVLGKAPSFSWCSGQSPYHPGRSCLQLLGVQTAGLGALLGSADRDGEESTLASNTVTELAPSFVANVVLVLPKEVSLQSQNRFIPRIGLAPFHDSAQMLGDFRPRELPNNKMRPLSEHQRSPIRTSAKGLRRGHENLKEI